MNSRWERYRSAYIAFFCLLSLLIILLLIILMLNRLRKKLLQQENQRDLETGNTKETVVVPPKQATLVSKRRWSAKFVIKGKGQPQCPAPQLAKGFVDPKPDLPEVVRSDEKLEIVGLKTDEAAKTDSSKESSVAGVTPVAVENALDESKVSDRPEILKQQTQIDEAVETVEPHKPREAEANATEEAEEKEQEEEKEHQIGMWGQVVRFFKRVLIPPE